MRCKDKCHRHREAYEKGKEQHVLHKPKYQSIYNTKLNNITIYDTDNNKQVVKKTDLLIRKNFLNCQKLKKEAKKKDYGADFKVQKTSL